MLLVRVGRFGNREAKRTSLSFGRLHPYLAPMEFHDPFHDSEPHAGSCIDPRQVQAVEEFEDAIVELRCDSDSVVLDFKDEVVLLLSTAQHDVRRCARLDILHRVGQEIRPDLPQPRAVRPEHRHAVVQLNGGSGCLDHIVQVIPDLVEKVAHRDPRKGLCHSVDAGVFKKVLDEAFHPSGAGLDAVQVMALLPAQTVFSLTAEQVGKAMDGAEGGLEVVRNRIDETLQFLIAGQEGSVRRADVLQQQRVFDEDAGLACEGCNDLFIGVGEFVAALLLREVEAAEKMAMGLDGSAEERMHRRMVRRESHGGRMGRQIFEP